MSAPAIDQERDGEAAGDRRREVLAILTMTIFLSLTFIDETGVAVTLPTMQAELGFSQSGLDWVMNAFFVTLSTCVLAAGRLADMLGHRRIFIAGIAVFAAASVGVAAAGSPAVVLISRGVQGLGAALMLATYAVLLGRVFPPARQGMALGTTASLASIFLAAGPLIGGVFVQVASWRILFAINLPIALGMWFAVRAALPGDAAVSSRQRFDTAGFVLFAVGFASLIAVLMNATAWGWRSPLSLSLLGMAAAALGAFVVLELRLREPLAVLRLFTSRSFLSANVVLLTSQVAALVVVFWALWLQFGLEYSPLQTGLAMLPAGLPILAVARFGGRWADNAGAQAPIRAGTLLCLAAMVWMAFALHGVNYAAAVVGMLLYAIGAPLAISPAIKTVLLSAPPEHAGNASGILNTMRNLGAALCFGVVGSVIQASQGGIAQTAAGYRDASAAGMWAAAAFCLLGVIFAWFGSLPAQQKADEAGERDEASASFRRQ